MGDRQALLKFCLVFRRTSLGVLSLESNWDPPLQESRALPVELHVRCTLGLLLASELSYILLCYSELYCMSYGSLLGHAAT
jgi:hypothetical protein